MYITLKSYVIEFIKMGWSVIFKKFEVVLFK